MAVTVTPVLSGKTTYIAQVTATADADTDTGATAHGLGSAPLDYDIAALDAVAQLSLWYLTAVGAANYTLNKATTVGSGGANPQVQVRLSLPHTLVQ